MADQAWLAFKGSKLEGSEKMQWLKDGEKVEAGWTRRDARTKLASLLAIPAATQYATGGLIEATALPFISLKTGKRRPTVLKVDVALPCGGCGLVSAG